MTLPRSLMLAGLLALAGSCDSPQEPAEPVPTVDLPCAATVGGSWESSGWPPGSSCDWFDFQGATTYSFTHPLGEIPTVILGYIAFEPDGAGATPASGDSFLVQEATATTVTIRNGTNQNFYLRLVLQ